MRYSSLAVCMLPVISYSYVLAFWLLASLSLGDWAIPSIHDPSDFLMGIPLALHVILLLLSFAVAPIALAVGYWRGRLTQQAIAYTTCLILSILLFRLDVYQVTTWIAD
jgi:hypothetical protein